ncbi:hypothetical protein A3D14_02470 [Candidatus Saccharibacteria bacterium RIFCSPHIGHO2_02_FULL_47_12]|nr:MAG: hypothetical protein A3D14_02470 [Candidatus Saccharibacteria bacterium RIFCSPHIGHO2_02_FULL_47_12]
MAKKTNSQKKKTKARSNPQAKKAQLNNLRVWNLATGLILAVQAVVLIVVGSSASVAVTNGYLTKNTLASQAAGKTVMSPATHHLFDVRLSYIIAALLLLAAATKLLVATIYRERYEADLKQSINRSRWLGYSLSGGLALVTVALINGVSDIATLISIFALTEILALICVLIESVKDLKKHPRIAAKLPFVAGITPWLVVAIYLFGAQIYGSPGLPAYVYFVDASIFSLLLATAAIMWMNGHKRRKFADYIYTERACILVNFVLLSALAWQIYGGV